MSTSVTVCKHMSVIVTIIDVKDAPWIKRLFVLFKCLSMIKIKMNKSYKVYDYSFNMRIKHMHVLPIFVF